MMERLIRASLEQRVIVLLIVAGLVVGGVAAFTHLPIDAFPECDARPSSSHYPCSIISSHGDRASG